MEAAARKLVEMGAHAVIVKGGHMEKAVDLLLDGDELHLLSGDRVKLEHTQGTGCTFRVGHCRTNSPPEGRCWRRPRWPRPMS